MNEGEVYVTGIFYAEEKISGNGALDAAGTVIKKNTAKRRL